MSDEYCPECGAKITGKTGFCSECGAVTTSLNNQIEETKKIEKIEKIEKIRKKYYHKPDKSHKMALIFSIFLPFFGNLYLRENIINLVATIVSILFIFANIIGLLTISDFYYHYNYFPVCIYVILWIVSMFTLTIFIIEYNNHEVYYKKDDDKYSRRIQIIEPV